MNVCWFDDWYLRESCGRAMVWSFGKSNRECICYCLLAPSGLAKGSCDEFEDFSTRNIVEMPRLERNDG